MHKGSHEPKSGSPRTLKQMMRNIAVYLVFNDNNILCALEKKLAKVPDNCKVVFLVIDDMAIKGGVSYDNGRDLIEGFCEGQKGGKVLANHAIAFMVRGIREKWKQPIGYFLSSGPMKGDEMKELVMECISKLKAIGLTVVVLICDQGSNNRNLFEKHLKVSIDKPYFIHDSQTIFTMYDPPHLVKNIRNNFR